MLRSFVNCSRFEKCIALPKRYYRNVISYYINFLLHNLYMTVKVRYYVKVALLIAIVVMWIYCLDHLIKLT